jgi:hypothetical protein
MWKYTPNPNIRCRVVQKQLLYYGKLQRNYEACPESKDTKVLNMYIFNLQKQHCE